MGFLSVLILVLLSAVACVGESPTAAPVAVREATPTATPYPEETVQAADSAAMPKPTPGRTPTATPIPTMVRTPTTVLPESCPKGVAVANPQQNPELVWDCEALLPHTAGLMGQPRGQRPLELVG